jgi:ribose transport system ATP-binding protein
MKISLAAQHIVKRYGGVIALSDGNLDVQSGEVLALMGANGSGKSTLGKIITGVVAPDEGQLLLDGQKVNFSSPQAARKNGIVEVYQELSLVPDMTVSENIWLTHEPLAWSKMVRNREVRARTRDLLDLFAGTIRPSLQPDALVSTLTPDERQIVEILKALSLQPRIMILDEATASLDSRQVNRLFELVARWKAQGVALVFISHRMEEIFRVADRVTVLRSGKTVGNAQIGQISEQELVNMMVESGIVSRRIKHHEEAESSPVRLSVEHMRTSVLRGVSLSLREGELLGLGGLRGQGQSDVLLALFGAIPFQGKVMLSGRSVHFTHPRQAMRAGIAFVPGDRGAEGLLPVRSILENLQLPSWRRYGQLLQLGRARKDADAVAHRLSLVMESLNAPVNSLSGGNAQKVVLGKWLLRDPQILLLDDPTKGVDVGAKGEFYKILAELRDAGKSIILYSSEDEELLGLCDRVIVLNDGQVQAELADARLTRSELVAASMSTAHGDTV